MSNDIVLTERKLFSSISLEEKYDNRMCDKRDALSSYTRRLFRLIPVGTRLGQVCSLVPRIRNVVLGDKGTKKLNNCETIGVSFDGQSTSGHRTGNFEHAISLYAHVLVRCVTRPISASRTSFAVGRHVGVPGGA